MIFEMLKFKCFVASLLVIAATAFMAGCGEKRPPNNVKTIADVKGKQIGVISGSPSARVAEELGTAHPCKTTNELMSDLLTGAVDCVIMEKSRATELTDSTPNTAMLAEPLLEYELRFAVAKENTALRDAINVALGALAANGVLDGLRDKYFSGKPYVYVSPENIAPHPGKLTLAISPHDKPFAYFNSEGDYTGFNIQIAIAVCDYLGVEIGIAEFETGELITAVWYGKADMALGWLPNDVLDRVDLSDPYADSSHVVIVRK